MNCVSPGFIKTDMTEALTEQQKNSILKQIPIGNFGEASDVAEAVFFLAGDMTSHNRQYNSCKWRMLME